MGKERYNPGGGGGGGTFFMWPMQGRATGQGLVFWPLCPEQSI